MDVSPARRRNFVAAIVAGLAALIITVVLIATADARLEWAEAAAKLPPGKQLRVEPMVATCLWWAGCALAATAAAAGLMAAVACHFGGTGWIGPARLAPLLPGPAATPRWFWPALIAIVVVAFCLRLPRMTLSFYNDESHNYVRIIAGEWKDYGTDKAKFRDPRWAETAFRNSTGNNGFLFSILARASLDGWRVFHPHSEGVIREWPVRLPSLLAGLLTVAVVGAVGLRMGSPAAGIAAAILLAIHPWHVRYSTEARAYALMMLAMAAGYLFLLAGLQSGRWRHWLAHGMCQFFALWANPGALIAITIGQLGVALLLTGWWWVRQRPEAIHHAIRWTGGGVLAVLAAGFALSPGLIQLREQLQHNPAMVGTIPAGWWRDTLFFLGNGCGWGLAGWENPVNPGSIHSPLRMLGAIAFFALAGLGLAAARSRPAARIAAVLACLHFFSLVPFYLRSVLSANVLLWWYALPALPGLILLAAHAFAAPRPRRLATVLAVVFALSAASALSTLMFHGKSDGRSLVRLARGGDFPDFDRRVITFDLWSDAVTYDPLARWAHTVEDLTAAGKNADAAGTGLFVYTGHESKAAMTHPEVLRFLHDPAVFEKVSTAWALEAPVHDNHLYRWRGPARPPENPATDRLRPDG